MDKSMLVIDVARCRSTTGDCKAMSIDFVSEHQVKVKLDKSSSSSTFESHDRTPCRQASVNRKSKTIA